MFKLVRTEDEALTRVQQNVKQAFDALDPSTTGIVQVSSSAGVKLYAITATDTVVIVNARGGTMKIAFPPPDGTTQDVTVSNAFTGANKLTLTRSDGKPFGNGLTVVELNPLASRRFVDDGSEWWALP